MAGHVVAFGPAERVVHVNGHPVGVARLTIANGAWGFHPDDEDGQLAPLAGKTFDYLADLGQAVEMASSRCLAAIKARREDADAEPNPNTEEAA